jgi:hypothetical protein
MGIGLDSDWRSRGLTGRTERGAMIFLIVLGVIGMVSIAACVYAVSKDGYGPVRTRSTTYNRFF